MAWLETRATELAEEAAFEVIQKHFGAIACSGKKGSYCDRFLVRSRAIVAFAEVKGRDELPSQYSDWAVSFRKIRHLRLLGKHFKVPAWFFFRFADGSLYHLDLSLPLRLLRKGIIARKNRGLSHDSEVAYFARLDQMTKL
jgi:hypothetical protein